MRKVMYEVKTTKGNVTVSTLARANEIVAEKGGTFKTVLKQIAENPLQISEKKMKFLKSGAKLPTVSYSTVYGGRG